MEESENKTREIELLNSKIQEDFRVLKLLSKEQKQEKRSLENELMKERAKSD